MDRDLLSQLRHLLRPIATRVSNTVARAVVQLVNDGKKLQLVQLGILADEDGDDDAEHYQPYGFTSVPLAGAEAVVVFPNGDRGHPLVVAVSDRRYRPTGGQAGEVTMYSHTGAKIRMLANGDVELHPAPGGKVIVSDGGLTDSLVTKTEFMAHVHATAGVGAPSVPSVTILGTSTLKAQ